ncbi:OsmC/Ohr family protein [Microbacterium esteraromaticum]|uniref:OsmC/Ohr family protein n=1 Tax=Microbacterium esteraromaticum TaxID=57043 RepID=A0A1R4KPP7_9MICO|nr:OsmC family protein [Microbacterium esteraromaticum]SJN46270.1 OsmC/Ohr family protein [Microbacterium esteraromaticum]
MALRYQTEAINTEGGNATSRIVDGMEVSVSSPLGAHPDPDATNPEQLLALAWVTCLNSTLQAIVERKHRTAVRVEVGLHTAEGGYEFHVDAFISAEGISIAETEELAAAGHARCPVSKLLRTAANVHVHAEEYVAR